MPAENLQQAFFVRKLGGKLLQLSFMIKEKLSEYGTTKNFQPPSSCSQPY